MNLYHVYVPMGHFLVYYAETADEARLAAEQDGHRVTRVRFVRDCKREDDR
jgi:hypothetical protein